VLGMCLKFVIALAVIIVIFCIIDLEAFTRIFLNNISFLSSCDEVKPVTEEIQTADVSFPFIP
jgi:hypothetical protein